MKKRYALIMLTILIICLTPYSANALPEETHFHEIFDSHGSVMLLIDSQTGDIEYANGAAAEFYGYSRHQLESMKISDINTLDPESTSAEMKSAVSEKRNYFVFEHRLSNGDIRTVEVYSYPYIIENREMLFSVVHDITYETQLEAENKRMNYSLIGLLGFFVIFLLLFSIVLNRNLKKLKKKNNEIVNFGELRKTFVDADNRLIYLKDENLKYVFVNKAFMDFYGLEESEIIGVDDFSLSDPEFADIRRKTDLNVLEKMQSLIDEVRWDNRIFKTNKFPIKMMNGQYGVGAYIEDITEEYKKKKREEKTLLRNSILLEVLNHNFNTSEEQLDYVLNESLRLTESKFGYIYLYNEESKEFILNSWSKGVMEECSVMDRQTIYQLEKTGLWGEVVRQRKPIILNDFEMPHPLKKGYPEGHVRLTKYMSVPVIIDGKIVAVVGLANKDDDYDDNDISQITLLMNGVWNVKERKERTNELEEAIISLKENEDKLQLILDSTAEAIYGLDTEGNCTFCNSSCLKLLGYARQEDLIGKNMHLQIHHSHRDGAPMNIKECRIFKASSSGKGTSADDEVFWRADGACFDVEYHSYPQYRDGEIIGLVVTFMDITERKKTEKEIKNLSYHDSLTGLYNRRFFEEELNRVDTQRNLPISIIQGDVNGLKLTNDIFGHASGDLLLKKVAEVFRKVCRADDIIARWGGDEFIILLPNTNEQEANAIKERITEQFAKEHIKAIKGSISIGCNTKTSPNQDILRVLDDAEDKMYQEKTLNRKSINSGLIDTIINTLHEKNPGEKKHSAAVRDLAVGIGVAMGLSEVELRKIRDASFLHDIGKIALDERILKDYDVLSDKEMEEFRQHPVTGYRILNSFDDTLDLAEPVLAHHERWDGGGYPKGLKQFEIPMLARMIAVAESFDKMTNGRSKNAMTTEEAVMELKRNAGSQFDPEIVKVFINNIDKIIR